MNSINMSAPPKPIILKSRFVATTPSVAASPTTTTTITTTTTTTLATTSTKGNNINQTTSVGNKGPMVIATLRADGKVYAKDSQSAKQLATMHYKIRPVNATIPQTTTTIHNNKSLQTLSIPTTVVDLGKQLLMNARDGNVAAVKSLILRDAPFSGDWLGMTALHFAAMNNHYEICDILIKNGINKDSRTKTDRTALHLACHNGNEKIVRLLLSKKCQINPCDMLHMTPLHWAIEKRHKSIARLLISHNADVTVVSKFGKTPIALAVLTEQADLLEALQAARTAQVEQKMRAQRESEISNAVNSIIEHDNTQEDEHLSNELNETSNESCANSTAVHLLQKHGISLQKHKENESKDLLNTVLKNGRQFILSEGGKMLLTEARTNVKNNIVKKPTNSVLLVSTTTTSTTTTTASATAGTSVNIPRNITVNTINKNQSKIQILPPMKILVNPNSNRIIKQTSDIRTLDSKFAVKTSPKKAHAQIKQEYKTPSTEESIKIENDSTNLLDAVNGIDNTSQVESSQFTNKFADSNYKMTTTIPIASNTAPGGTPITAAATTTTKPSNNATTITQTAPGSVIPLFSLTNMCRQLFELRRQHNELKRKFELSQREKEDMRVRLARLENYVSQTSSNNNDVDYVIDI